METKITTKTRKNERHIFNSIREKLLTNNARAIKADKYNSFVITYVDDYHKKVHDFISNNKFFIVNNDLNSTFQKRNKKHY